MTDNTVTTYTADQLAAMGKMDLRTVCKSVGVKNASSMTNDGMRAAVLQALENQEVEATPPPASTLASLFGLTASKDATVPSNVTRVIDGKKQDDSTEDKPKKTQTRKSVAGYNIQADRPKQNGIRRPSYGTTTEAIWAYYDLNLGLTFPALKAGAAAYGWNSITMHRQYQEWRRFNGMIPVIK